MTPEDKKELEDAHAEAVKTEMEAAKKEADATVEKNPVPKEEKKALMQHVKEEKAEETIKNIDK